MINKMILVVLLCIISCKDIKYRIIPNWCCVAIVINAIIYLEIDVIVMRTINGVTVLIILILIRYISKKTLGGGDIKLIAVGTFALGIDRVLWGLMIGMLIILLRYYKFKPEKYIPLGPYICLGMLCTMW